MEWVPIRIPKPIVEEIDKILKETGYWLNRNDFARDAVREKIESIRNKGVPSS